MTAIDHLDATAVRTLVERYRDALRAHREELNRLNVYPVPDGDTGTNMVLTLESVLQEIDGARSMAEVCQAMAHGSLMGARGNSGVILSQILRGLAAVFSEVEKVDAPAFAKALSRASEAAYDAVMRPVEGTILTVVRDSAEAAGQVGTTESLAGVLEATREAAAASLARTPDLLPVLKEAGVVDAGAKGFVLFLDACLNVVADRPVPEPEVVDAPEIVRAHMEGDDVSALRYEVMFLLEADDGKIGDFKDAWAAVGDSIVVVGGEGLWNCHVHTDQIGAAIEAGIETGRPRNIQVTDLAEQVEEEQWVREHGVAGAADDDRGDPCETAVVAVAVGDGLRRLFKGLGVSKVVAGGQTMNPSTQQILEAVEACPSDAVVVLPNNKNIVPVASRVGELTSKRVEVVPTTSVVEGLCSLIEYDPQAAVDANVAAISEGVRRIKTGEVTRAVRDAPSELGPITEGDWIALAPGGLRAVEQSAVDAAAALVADLVDADDELITVVVGADVTPQQVDALKERIALAHPELEVEFHDGSQPLYPFLVGIE